MSKPINKFSFGKVQGAVWENDYQGKKSYSMTFQKSYQDKDKNWKHTSFFTMVDLRDLYVLVGSILSKQVKEQGSTPKKQEPRNEPAQNNHIDKPGEPINNIQNEPEDISFFDEDGQTMPDNYHN